MSVKRLLVVLVAILALLESATAARVPGQKPGVHYPHVPSHYREFRGLDEEDIVAVVCDEEDSLIPGIPVTFTNGSCHDLEDVNKGASQLEHIRLLDAAFIDGRGIPDGQNRPSAREISNRVVKLPEGLDPNIKLSSRLLIFFGQFMDHDFALILEQEELEIEDEDEIEPVEDAPELLAVEIPEDDEQFDPEEPMEFGRSEFCLDENFVRQFEAEITPWLDLGNVYGDTQERTDLLRAFEGGRMAVTEFDGAEFPLLNETTGLFLCGDIRCEENTMLFGWHTLFLRNHNYWADEYRTDAGLDPIEDDEEIFQNARIRNIVDYQQIVWDQYLPYLLGRRTFFDLTGEYELDEEEDPACTLIFTTAVFRYGHSGVSDDFVFLDDDLEQTRATLALAESFNNVDPLTDDAERLGEIFVGQASLAHDILDSRVVDGIRDNLFANIEDFFPGFDLAARNIERGRDHGIQTINFYRDEFGLDPYQCEDDPRDCFYQLTSDIEIADALYELYGDIEECEMWVCGMAEDSFEDSLLGETFTVIMSEQFNRMRNADRIWYENIQGELEDAEAAPMDFPVTLVDVVERNTEIEVPMENMFMVEPVWEAFSDADRWQVEWYLPPRLRDSIESYEIVATGAGTQTYTVEDGELLYVVENQANGGTEYEVTVTAILRDGETEVLGSVILQTEDGVALSTGAIVGIVIGSVAGAVLLGAGVVLLVRRRRSKAFGAGQDTFLQL